MIDTVNGSIILCESGFAITSALTPSELEKSIGDHILRIDKIGNGYVHYFLGCDINPGEYVYLGICFFEETIFDIKIMPQQKSYALSELKPKAMDWDLEKKLASEWYQANCSKQEEWPWGKLSFCPGTDPIYHLPMIVIKYK